MIISTSLSILQLKIDLPSYAGQCIPGGGEPGKDHSKSAHLLQNNMEEYR